MEKSNLEFVRKRKESRGAGLGHASPYRVPTCTKQEEQLYLSALAASSRRPRKKDAFYNYPLASLNSDNVTE